MPTPSTPSSVLVRRGSLVLPAYLPERPNPHPMFFERRVYQGSSGRVYPLPLTDRIAEKPRPCAWDAVWIENEFIRVLILPQLGGRIHRAEDLTNGYDFIYHQPVIKPALVGLAGPWASGGIEFNWPQHHRPSTFMPTEVAVEHHPDGAATVWLSEHDPMARMKGMHGVRLHPGRSCLELAVRLYNRTPDVQTFLWWANAAVRVHEQYQSFFPPDVTHVADHARRAISAYPLCRAHYYGVDYGARARAAGRPPGRTPPPAAPPPVPARAPNDLSWFANLPVPTSYMCLGSQGDFAGGYDHRVRAGLIQIANHHIAPGKKVWTWGHHEFGRAWDRNLTDPDEHGEHRPYLELMSGVYTDNQPDFSFLQPGETRTWSQFWYPIRSIGPARKANVEAAVSLELADGLARIGVAATAVHPEAVIRLFLAGQAVGQWTQTIAPDRPHLFELRLDRAVAPADLALSVHARDGRELIHYQAPSDAPPEPPIPAEVPAEPAAITSADELFVTGLHLEQYRHATRAPEPYWREALRRDPGDARCNLALGRWHLRRGELELAEQHLRASIARLTLRNANPVDSEPFYQLGLCLRQQAFADPPAPDRVNDAYASFYKATWNHAWQAAAFHALAEIDATRHDWTAALDHLDRALRVNADNLRARNLKAMVLQRLGRPAEAARLVAETLALDPLDGWARRLRGDPPTGDMQTRFDLALDHARAGFLLEALAVLAKGPAAPAAAARTQPPPARLPDASLGAGPMLHYYRAWLCQRLPDAGAVRRHLTAAARSAPAHCFPARVEEIAILRFAMATRPQDARAPFYLGNLLYDRRRHQEAIRLWEQAVAREPGNATAWRNLGLGYHNVLRQPDKARAAYERAFRACPGDARLLHERDQLWKRQGEAPARRLRELRRHPDLVRQRDDLAVELCALYNQTGAPRRALAVLTGRRFQPWEGGEGLVLSQHERTHLALGRRALRQRRATVAVRHFTAALTAPANLGEAKHPLANRSNLRFWLGCALAAAGDQEAARAQWTEAAESRGDFQGMAVHAFSAMTYYSARALQKLGRRAEATRLLRQLRNHAARLARTPAAVDYFATSLPAMLLFDDDLPARQRTTAMLLEAQARLGLGQTAPARRLLRAVLRRDPSHELAADLLD